MDNCIFCKIVRGEIPAAKIYEDEHTLAFLDINPATEYHTLIIPKKHYVNMFDIPETEAAHIMRTIKKVIALYEKKLNMTDVNVVNNSGKKAHQEVFHLHYHIVPRFTNEKIGVPFPEHPELREKFAEMLKRIK
jgi:histidine triad (HIT) family protein